LPQHAQTVLPAEDGLPAPTTELAAYWQQRHERALDDAGLKALLHDRLKLFQLSPTHINDFTDLEHAGPQAFFMRTILRFPQAPRPEVAFGNAMHETLQWLHITAKKEGRLPPRAALLHTFKQHLSAKRLSAQHTAQFLERGQAALAAYFEQRAHTVLPHNVAEHNFRKEGVFAGEAHLSGTIDKLIIDPEAKTLTIVDFKTGKSYARWTRDLKLHKYRRQLYLYRTLVEGSHTFSGYQVTDAYLEFVEPNEQGIIQELHLPFDKAEYERSQRLAQAIWQHIRELRLPDVSTYSQDLKGVEAFESDLCDLP
jgi:DNA helicase-2/ATP-dependent DNA helicase PcrA